MFIIINSFLLLDIEITPVLYMRNNLLSKKMTTTVMEFKN